MQPKVETNAAGDYTAISLPIQRLKAIYATDNQIIKQCFI